MVNIMSLTSYLDQWRALSRFNAVNAEARSIVFYAADAVSWRYFEPIINQLLATHEKNICYVTSSDKDPVLKLEDSRIQTFCIGLGIARTLLFMFLRADVMVMTMPDLESFHIKRSTHSVHYVYLYHSMVSSHMVYRRGAFDHFDSILCVGPHHQQEIRATELLYGLKPKVLVEAGYAHLDSILLSQKTLSGSTSQTEGSGNRVLIAPSWGGDGLIESHGLELVEVLLRAGHNVTLRPHSMTIRQRPKLLRELRERFACDPNFHLELDLTAQGTVQSSDIMISDWSGAALEFAFGLERPVLFVDVPRKVNNPEYERIPLVPIEVQLRSEIGEVVSPDRLSDVPAIVDRLCKNPDSWKERMQELRSRWIYNIGTSSNVAAAYISDVADRVRISGATT